MFENKRKWDVYRETIVMRQKGKWPSDVPIEQPELLILHYKKVRLHRFMQRVGLAFNNANAQWKRVARIEDWVVVQNISGHHRFHFYISHHHDDGRAWYTLEHNGGPVPEAACPKCGEAMPRQCAAWIKINHLGTLLEGGV